MIEVIKKSIRAINNFPKEGIVFRDITTAIKDKDALKAIVDEMYEHYKNANIDYVLGVESRGFIFGAPLAYKLGCGLIIARKQGKLPAETVSVEYELEYGTDKMEVHADAIEKGKNVLIVDDLLATGGTALAACKLVEKVGGNPVSTAFVIELKDLKGREKFPENVEVYTIVSY